jgi:hypothetical protein
MEPALWSGGAAALGVLDATNTEGGGVLPLNALMSALPMLAAAGGAGALALRSPTMNKYIGDRLGRYTGGRRLQSEAREQEALKQMQTAALVQQVLQPGLSKAEASRLVLAQTRERLRGLMGNAAASGAALAGLGILSHEGGAA